MEVNLIDKINIKINEIEELIQLYTELKSNKEMEPFHEEYSFKINKFNEILLELEFCKSELIQSGLEHFSFKL
jgi:hypothetical protein